MLIEDFAYGTGDDAGPGNGVYDKQQRWRGCSSRWATILSRWKAQANHASAFGKNRTRWAELLFTAKDRHAWTYSWVLREIGHVSAAECLWKLSFNYSPTTTLSLLRLRRSILLRKIEPHWWTTCLCRRKAVLNTKKNRTLRRIRKCYLARSGATCILHAGVDQSYIIFRMRPMGKPASLQLPHRWRLCEGIECVSWLTRPLSECRVRPRNDRFQVVWVVT